MMAKGLGVVLISSQPQWGGGEQWLWSLGKGLSQMGVRVHWIAPEKSPMAQRLESSSYSWLPVHGKGRSLRDLHSIRNFIRRSDIDLIHFNDSHAVIGTSLAVFDCRRIARVWTKHTIFPLRWRQKYRWMIDRVVCVSRAAQKAVIDCGLRPEQTAVIYGAVDEPQFDSSARSDLLSELNWDVQSRIIMCVGNLLSCKGHRYVVEAMPMILNQHPQAKLVIAGEGKERGELERLIVELNLENSVKLLGFRSDATRLLSAADVVAQPSLSEALSLVAIESQMLLKPLVATAVGGLAEVVRADLESPLAELIRTESSVEVARGVNAVFQGGDELQWRCQRAKAAAHDRFSMSRMVNEILGVYDTLVRARQGERTGVRQAS
jgi:glycosyltransferase involved in cell wall biosynthesis